jgi:outer membrane protein, heavy metal efflux system
MKFRRLTICLSCICLLTAYATAQERPAAKLTIEEAVRFGLDHNKNLAADRGQIAEALGRLKQAGLKANPMVESAGLASINNTGMQNLSVGVTLPLEVGRRARRITLADHEVERMRNEVADRERMLSAEIRMKFAEALETRQKLELTQQIVRLDQEILGLIRARVEEGVSARVEENMQTIELRRVEARASALASQFRVRIEELKGLLGWPAGANGEAIDALQLGGELPVAFPEVTSKDLTELIALARQNRPDLQAALTSETIGESMIEMARAEGRFDLSIFGELGWQRWGFDQMAEMNGRLVPIGMQNGMLKAGVNIMLPVRNRNQGNIEAAAAWRQSARLRREFIESIVHREATAATEKLRGAASVLQTFDNQLIESQEKNYQILRTSFELGHARLGELLAEQRRLIELKMEQTEARRELLLAAIELARAINGPLAVR